MVGKHVITIEGIGNVDNPHPLQERIAKLHGSQCGFCTPGIVMSLYALVRNAYDPTTKCFHLSEHDIELAGHLDGNLCRCTGYKPILKAAKTFIVEDLKGKIVNDFVTDQENLISEKDRIDAPYTSETQPAGQKKTLMSCGRPGGCCRDTQIPVHGIDLTIASDNSSSSGDDQNDSPVSDTASSASSVTSPEGEDLVDDSKVPTTGASYGKPLKSRENAKVGAEVEGLKTKTGPIADGLNKTKGYPVYDLKPYSPQTELLFPPSLRNITKTAICYGDSKRIWLRPVTLEQLLEIKNAYPSAKLVGGSSEVQVEVRFKNTPFAVSVYVSDLSELRGIVLPKDESALASMTELVIRANTSLTDIEDTCKVLFAKLGRRAQVLEATRKQLRYFAGRQIRNVASLAGNIATASPISDMNPVLLASRTILTAQSLTRGTFSLPLSSFFIGYRTTSLPADAIITDVRIPLASPNALEVTKAYKQAKRKDDDIAIVTAAFRVRLDNEGLVEDITLAFGGMAPKTVEATKTMNLLQGKKWHDMKTLDDAMSELAVDFDLRFGVPGGMATYRRTLAISLFYRYWHEVISDLGLGEVDSGLIDEIHRNISAGARDDYNPHEQRVVGKQIPHLSALKQATGEAEYVDDMSPLDRELFGAMVLSSKAKAKIISIDWTPAIGEGLALGYVDKDDIPNGANGWGSLKKDEPFFADGIVESEGQPIGMVYAETALQAQAAAKAVKVEYEDLPAILTIDEAIAAKSFYAHGKELRKGAAREHPDKMADIWAKCDRIFEGTSRMGGQ